MEVGQAINAAPKLGFGLLGSLPTKFLDPFSFIVVAPCAM
jgi:hypothetical protein